MVIWRLSKFVDLGGRGGLAVSGRWHNKPTPILYCAAEPHTAYLETVRQVGMPAVLPDEVKVLKIHVPDFVLIEELDTEALDPDWHESDGWRHCRPIGDAWLATHRCAFLKVPSAARLGHFNYLGNPHARGWDDVTITEVIPQPFPAFVTEP